MGIRSEMACSVLWCFFVGVTYFPLSGVAADAVILPSLPLVTRTSEQAVLFVVGQDDREIGATETACRAVEMKVSVVRGFDIGSADFSRLHAIVTGSNAMDWFGGDANPWLKNLVFERIKQFVAEGGHLFLFGTYEGRNCERLKAFGIEPRGFHASMFEAIPGRSEVLWRDLETTVPGDGMTRSWGNLQMNPVRGPVDMLKRKHPEPWSQHPVLSTVQYYHGRVSYCTVEPHNDGMWLIPVVAQWIARGAPTVASQIGQEVVLSRADRAALLLKAAPSPQPLNAEASIEKLFATTRPFWESLSKDGDFLEADTHLCQRANELDLDSVDVQKRLLLELQASGWSEEPTFARAALLWADSAMITHRYRDAQYFAESAKAAAAVRPEPGLLRRINEFLQQLGPLAKEEFRVESALTAVQVGTATAEQMAIAGRFLALTCGKWDQGMYCLANGDDVELRGLAELDLSVPKTAPEQMDLANRWKRYAVKTSGRERDRLMLQSRNWFQSATELLRGNELKAVQKMADRMSPAIKKLSFRVRTGGSSRLRIDRDQMIWAQSEGRIPEDLQVNSRPWVLSKSTILLNRGVDRFLEEGAEFQNPRVEKTKGRGSLVVRDSGPSYVMIDLEDDFPGDDLYLFTVSIGGPSPEN